MKYLVDTCILSELMRPRPNASVCDWLSSVSNKSVYTACFSIGEIRRGILRLPASRRRSKLTATLENMIFPRLHGRIVACDMDVMDVWARLYAEGEQAGRTPSVMDSLIAATALVHGMTVVTRNAGDFEFKGLNVINPFDFAGKQQQTKQ